MVFLKIRSIRCKKSSSTRRWCESAKDHRRHWRRRKKKTISIHCDLRGLISKTFLRSLRIYKDISAGCEIFVHFTRSARFTIARFPTALEISRPLACDSTTFEFTNSIFFFFYSLFENAFDAKTFISPDARETDRYSARYRGKIAPRFA